MMEKEVGELISPEMIVKVFGIPRGTINTLIKNKGFPRALRVKGSNLTYYLVSQIQEWMGKTSYRPHKKKRVYKAKENCAPIEVLPHSTIQKIETAPKLKNEGSLKDWLLGFLNDR